MFHLPDLPNAGYATQRERELTDVITDFMRQTERNRLLMLTIVIEGKGMWRRRASVALGRGIGQDHQLLSAIYDYFTLQCCRPRTQRLLLRAAQNPQKWRDIVRIAMPHLERERETLRLMAKWSVN